MLRIAFAEKEGFEPPDLLQSTVFKTAAFDHSAISPKRLQIYIPFFDLKIFNRPYLWCPKFSFVPLVITYGVSLGRISFN